MLCCLLRISALLVLHQLIATHSFPQTQGSLVINPNNLLSADEYLYVR